MSEPGSDAPPPRPPGTLNFTGRQFILFAGVGVVALAALAAAGLALGLALAGAAVIAVLVLAIWIMAANLAGNARRRPRAGPRRDR